MSVANAYFRIREACAARLPVCGDHLVSLPPEPDEERGKHANDDGLCAPVGLSKKSGGLPE